MVLGDVHLIRLNMEPALSFVPDFLAQPIERIEGSRIPNGAPLANKMHLGYLITLSEIVQGASGMLCRCRQVRPGKSSNPGAQIGVTKGMRLSDNMVPMGEPASDSSC